MTIKIKLHNIILLIVILIQNFYFFGLLTIINIIILKMNMRFRKKFIIMMFP